MWCGSAEHKIITYPKRQSYGERSGEAKADTNTPKTYCSRKRYIMSKKEASNSGTVVTGTLFLNS